MTAPAMPARAELRTGRRARDAPGRAGQRLASSERRATGSRSACNRPCATGSRPAPADVGARQVRPRPRVRHRATPPPPAGAPASASRAQAASPAAGVNASCSSHTGTARLNRRYAVRPINAKKPPPGHQPRQDPVPAQTPAQPGRPYACLLPVSGVLRPDPLTRRTYQPAAQTTPDHSSKEPARLMLIPRPG